MTLLQRIRRLARDHYGGRRDDRFRRWHPDVQEIADIGGTRKYWREQPPNVRVTILNTHVYEQPSVGERQFRFIVGDARAIPLRGGTFDVAFSNSVIEHVGSFADQARFAEELRRLSDRIWCQTPNRWFVLEPHMIALIVHWLPRNMQTPTLVRWLSLWGWTARPSRESISAELSSIRLLSRREFSALFPDCRIETERFLGVLAKSFIAVRGSP
jgi:Methyltransferase domain